MFLAITSSEDVSGGNSMKVSRSLSKTLTAKFHAVDRLVIVSNLGMCGSLIAHFFCRDPPVFLHMGQTKFVLLLDGV